MTEQPIHNKKDKSSFSNFISGFSGGLVAVLLVGSIFWSISEAETDSAEQQEVPATNQTEEAAIPTTNITYEETNSVNAAVEQVSDAVVGVSNISQLNLWDDSETQGTGSGVI